VSLGGRGPYYRMVASRKGMEDDAGDFMRAILWVERGDHNLFSTEWDLLLDSDACPNGPLLSRSTAQELGIESMGSFFLGVLQNETYLRAFNPSYDFWNQDHSAADDGQVRRAYIGTLKDTSQVYYLDKMVSIGTQVTKQANMIGQVVNGAVALQVGVGAPFRPPHNLGVPQPSCVIPAAGLITTGVKADTPHKESVSFTVMPLSYNLDHGEGFEAASRAFTEYNGDITSAQLEVIRDQVFEEKLKTHLAWVALNMTGEDVVAAGYQYLYFDIAPTGHALNEGSDIYSLNVAVTNVTVPPGGIGTIPMGLDDSYPTSVSVHNYLVLDQAAPTFTGTDFANLMTVRVPLADFDTSALTTDWAARGSTPAVAVVWYPAKQTWSGDYVISSIRLATK